MALDQFVNTVKTLSSQGSLSELSDFLSKQVRRACRIKQDLDLDSYDNTVPGTNVLYLIRIQVSRRRPKIPSNEEKKV
jgi:hypothetical protein